MQKKVSKEIFEKLKKGTINDIMECSISILKGDIKTLHRPALKILANLLSSEVITPECVLKSEVLDSLKTMLESKQSEIIRND